MMPMEFIKGNASHTKLACLCGRLFWTTPNQIVRCPNCKEIWDGKIVKYVSIKLQTKRGEPYVTVFIGKHDNVGSCLSHLMVEATIAFYIASGIKAQEITREEFEAADQDQITKDCVKLLSEMRLLHD